MWGTAVLASTYAFQLNIETLLESEEQYWRVMALHHVMAYQVEVPAHQNIHRASWAYTWDICLAHHPGCPPCLPISTVACSVVLTVGHQLLNWYARHTALFVFSGSRCSPDNNYS